MSSKSSKMKIITRIISKFTKGDITKTPLESLKKVKIDSYLISLGLLSQRYGVEASVGQGFWRRTHQLFVLVLQWLMCIKWLVCASMPDSVSAPMIGDFTAYLPGSRFDYQFILMSWSAIGAVSASLFSRARSHHKLNLLWLKPFELCKGSVKHQDLKLGVEEASDFWQRVLFTLWVSKTIIRVLFLISVGLVVYILAHLWPKEHLYPTGVIWAVISAIWLYYLISIQIGGMAVFHMLCYYFISRFRRLNEIAKELELNHRTELMVMHQKINTFMTYHNMFAKEVGVYNKFWQYYMAMNFVIYVTIICFVTQLILFVKMILLLKILSLITIIALFLCLIFISFSAGAVSDEIHESYGVLNAISQNNMPLVLKTQLQIYIQRIGGPTMGFSCWDLFTVTYDGFFQAILMIGSFFLLFMDVIQSEKKKRNVTVDTQVIDAPGLA